MCSSVLIVCVCALFFSPFILFLWLAAFPPSLSLSRTICLIDMSNFADWGGCCRCRFSCWVLEAPLEGRSGGSLVSEKLRRELLKRHFHVYFFLFFFRRAIRFDCRFSQLLQLFLFSFSVFCFRKRKKGFQRLPMLKSSANYRVFQLLCQSCLFCLSFSLCVCFKIWLKRTSTLKNSSVC